MIELLLITFLNHAAIQTELLHLNKDIVHQEYVPQIKTVLFSPLDVKIRKKVRVYGRALNLRLNPYKGKKNPPRCRSPS